MDFYTFALCIISVPFVFVLFAGIIETIYNLTTKTTWRNQYYNERYVYPLIDDVRQHAYNLGMTDELKEIRKNLNLSIKDAARIFGVTYSAWGKWERGERLIKQWLINSLSFYAKLPKSKRPL